ncbi:MAG: WG repeat-containing protein, partial [candidate division WOR-3 bacterium]
ENKYGFIDTTGKLVIDFKFEEAGNFHLGICRVRDSRSGETYFIVRNGNIIKPSTEEIIRYLITEDF